MTHARKVAIHNHIFLTPAFKMMRKESTNFFTSDHTAIEINAGKIGKVLIATARPVELLLFLKQHAQGLFIMEDISWE